MKTRMTWFAVALFALAAPFAVAACGGDDNSGTPDARPISDIDAAMVDAGAVDAPPSTDADCITNPTTNEEILNGCTDQSVTKIPKHPTLPLLNPDGTLPPLP